MNTAMLIVRRILIMPTAVNGSLTRTLSVDELRLTKIHRYISDRGWMIFGMGAYAAEHNVQNTHLSPNVTLSGFGPGDGLKPCEAM